MDTVPPTQSSSPIWRIDPARLDAAPGIDGYLASVEKYVDLWRAVYRTATVDDAAVSRVPGSGAGWRLLALSEDWCTDAVSTVPVVARLAELAGIDLRILGRDSNPDIMDAHLTGGTRSIPIVLVLDELGRRWAWWGPRPAAVQRWMKVEGIHLPKEDRTRRKRAWYARDRGRTTAREIVETLERGARRRADAANR